MSYYGPSYSYAPKWKERVAMARSAKRMSGLTGVPHSVYTRHPALHRTMQSAFHRGGVEHGPWRPDDVDMGAVGTNPRPSLDEIKRLAKIRHEKERLAARRRGRKDFPMLPYECSWAYEEEFKRKHGQNPRDVGDVRYVRKYKTPQVSFMEPEKRYKRYGWRPLGLRGDAHPYTAEVERLLKKGGRGASKSIALYEEHKRTLGHNPELLIIGNPPHHRFKVIEHMNGYAIYDTVSGKDHWMSDGVDAVFTRSGRAMSPGTAGFIEAWERDLNSSPSETAEAYGFPSENPRRRTAMRRYARNKMSKKKRSAMMKRIAKKYWASKKGRARKARKTHRKRKGSRKAYTGKMVIRYKGQRIGKRSLIKKLHSTKKANTIWRKAKKMKSK